MLAGSSTRTLVVSSFCCVQHWRQGLGWGGPAQKCGSGAAGSHAGRSCKQGNRQERSSPQTGKSLSPRGGPRKPKPFPRPREQKSPRCLERAKGQASASLPRDIVAGWQGSGAAPARGFFLPTSKTGDLTKINARSPDRDAMPFEMRNKRQQPSPASKKRRALLTLKPNEGRDGRTPCSGHGSAGRTQPRACSAHG